MKKLLLLTTFSTLLMASSGIAAPAPSSNQLKALTQKLSVQSKLEVKVNENDISYMLGYLFGSQIKKTDTKLNFKEFESGLNVALKSETPRFDRQKMRVMLSQYQEEARARLLKRTKEEAETNLKESEAFLAANKSKKGVKTLKNGLQYKIIKKGSGRSPSAKDKVKIKYTGKLINGEVFDSSKDGKAVTMNLRRTIKGWREALPKMKIGATWELYIPSKLAYGTRGTPGKIGPNQALIFKVTLVDIESAKAKAKSAKKKK